MGSSLSTHNPELRAQAHNLNSYLNSKSTFLYQISLLKVKINSHSNYASLNNSKGIKTEIASLPTQILSLQQLSASKLDEKVDSSSIPSDLKEILSSKDSELLQLESKYSEVEQVIEKLISKRDDLSQKLKTQSDLKGDSKFSLNDLKEKCSEIVAESQNLESLIAELKEKLEFLNRKRSEIMIKRGNKRKSYLGMSILNKGAMDLKSKFILKQELIRTIQQTKSEQDMQAANFQMRSKFINIRNENLEDEEQALNTEISLNKDRIIELEWEIQKLNRERSKVKGRGSREVSIHFEEDRVDSDPGSLGSSLSSLMNGFGDYRLEKEAMAEENLKLKEHIKGIISVKRPNNPYSQFNK